MLFYACLNLIFAHEYYPREPLQSFYSLSFSLALTFLHAFASMRIVKHFEHLTSFAKFFYMANGHRSIGENEELFQWRG